MVAAAELPVERLGALAAGGGHLDVLQWARAHGCPLTLRVCALAAQIGRLEVLKWARAHDCPWSEATTTNAAAGGHMEVLKWAREHGCPWTAETRDAAATEGYTDNLPLSACGPLPQLDTPKTPHDAPGGDRDFSKKCN